MSATDVQTDIIIANATNNYIVWPFTIHRQASAITKYSSD